MYLLCRQAEYPDVFYGTGQSADDVDGVSFDTQLFCQKGDQAFVGLASFRGSGNLDLKHVIEQAAQRGPAAARYNPGTKNNAL